MAELYYLPQLLNAIELNNSSLKTDGNAVSYWRLEGNSNDAIGSNNGTDTSVTYSTANGKFGQGASFNGTSSKIVITDASNLKPTGNFTISAWVNSSTTPQRIFSSWAQNTNTAGFGLWLDGSNHASIISAKNTGVVAGTDYKQCSGLTTVNDGNWHMWTGKWDGSSLYIYLDGKLENSVAWANAPAYQATNYVRIGCQNNTGTDITFSETKIDDIFLFSRALTGDEIATLYGASGYWRMEGNSNDSKGINNGTDTAITYNATNGKFGQGAGFNGTSSNIKLLATAIPVGSTKRTLNAWVYKTTSAVDVIMGSTDGSANGTFGIYINNLRIYAWGSTDSDTGLDIVLNTWNMITVTYDGTNKNVYLNAGTPYSVAKTVNTVIDGSGFNLGSNSSSANFLHGNIDDFSIFPRALSSAEILTLYRAGSSLYIDMI